MRKISKKNFIEQSKYIHNNIFDYSLVEYINNTTKIKIICTKHGVFQQIPKAHKNGQGCPTCALESKSIKQRKSKSYFVGKSKKIHGETYDYSLVDYINNKTNVIIICGKHGKFEQIPTHHYNGSGCPICKESKGEKEIRNYLIENGVKYIPQYKFDDCRNIKPLPFDFYLPELNMCIEYDGVQHFKVKSLFGGESGLKSRQINDNIKTKYCEYNGISLLRIRYNENIIKKLNKWNKKNNNMKDT